MKFLALGLLTIASTASAKINLTAGIMRTDTPLETGKKLTLEVGQRDLCYQDETSYIEAELLEENAEQILLQFTVATKNETGAYMVRGLPKFSFTLNPGSEVMNGSMRCDGPSESFDLVVTVEKLEQTVPAVVAAQTAE